MSSFVTRRTLLHRTTAAGALAVAGTLVRIAGPAAAQDTVIGREDATPVAASPVAARGDRGAGTEALIAELLDVVTANYIFPDVAATIAEEIRGKVSRGEYAVYDDPVALAERLTADLRGISGDKHFGVTYNEDGPPPPPSDEMLDELLEAERMRNFGIVRAERLLGNLGFLDIRGFSNVPTQFVEETLAPAMELLANTSALIVDVSQNLGGSPATVALVCSYLLGPDPVQLNSIVWREGSENRTEAFWTQPVLAGPRYLDKPVYVLTSGDTFSAGEEFAYDLQALGRATIVGEKTGGGANPAQMFPLADGFGAIVPNGQAVNPTTGTNWEGTGVIPDLAVARDQALVTAQITALETVIETTVDDPSLSGMLLLDEARRALAMLEGL